MICVISTRILQNVDTLAKRIMIKEKIVHSYICDFCRNECRKEDSYVFKHKYFDGHSDNTKIDSIEVCENCQDKVYFKLKEMIKAEN